MQLSIHVVLPAMRIGCTPNRVWLNHKLIFFYFMLLKLYDRTACFVHVSRTIRSKLQMGCNCSAANETNGIWKRGNSLRRHTSNKLEHPTNITSASFRTCLCACSRYHMRSAEMSNRTPFTSPHSFRVVALFAFSVHVVAFFRCSQPLLESPNLMLTTTFRARNAFSSVHRHFAQRGPGRRA